VFFNLVSHPVTACFGFLGWQNGSRKKMLCTEAVAPQGEGKGAKIMEGDGGI
jgi:hypothetical protein